MAGLWWMVVVWRCGRGIAVVGVQEVKWSKRHRLRNLDQRGKKSG